MHKFRRIIVRKVLVSRGNCELLCSVLRVKYFIYLGLILCSEPYYNEAGYEKQRGTVEGRENSRLYNEMVLLKLVQSMERLLRNPPAGLENEILKHFAHHGAR